MWLMLNATVQIMFILIGYFTHSRGKFLKELFSMQVLSALRF